MGISGNSESRLLEDAFASKRRLNAREMVLYPENGAFCTKSALYALYFRNPLREPDAYVGSPPLMFLQLFSTQRIWLTLSLALSAASYISAHPADTDVNSRLAAAEVAAYTDAADSEPELSLQAVNIWKHGERYRALDSDGGAYYVPAPDSGSEFVALATLSPAPATLARVHGLPESDAGYEAFYYAPTVEDVVFDGHLVEENGEWFLAIPTHPIDAVAGGELEFTIYPSGTAATPSNSYRVGAVSVQGLPSAPGALVAYREKANALVARIESDSGIDFSDYFTGAPREFGPYENRGQQTLILIVRYWQDPGFPQGLVELDEEVLDGSTPFLVGLRAEIDALMAQTDVLEWIDEFGLAPSGGAAAEADPITVKSEPLASAPLEHKTLDLDAQTDAMRLAELMSEQYVANQMLQDELFGLGVGSGNAAIGLAGAPGQIVSAEVGLTISALRLSYEEKAYTYPANGAITATFGETHFYADDCDLSSSWTAKASASSLGWSTDGAVMDLAVSLIGAGGAGVSAAKAVKQGTQVAEAAGEGTKAAMRKHALDTAESGAEFGAGEAAKSVADTSSTQEVPPESWTGIELGEDFAKMVQVGSPVLDVDGDAYSPVAPGEALAYISAGQPEFPPGGLAPSEPVSIRVEEAAVTLSGCPPSRFTPGEIYTLTAQVEGLRDKNVPFTWQSTAGALTPVESSVPGQAQAIWEAPNPAPSDIITLTATADAAVCIPLGATAPTASCVTSGSDFELVVSPVKTCYDVGEVVTLTYMDLTDPGHAPGTEFELVSGLANLTKTGDNTATVTVASSGEIGVAARLISNPNQMNTAILTFGCGEPMGLSLQPGPEPGVQLLTFVIEDRAYTLYGAFTGGGGQLTAEFDANSTYQYLLSITDPEATQPTFGDVGVYIGSNFVPVNNPDLSITLNFLYEAIDCPGGTAPGSACIQAVNTTPQSVIIEGLSADYDIRPDLSGVVVAGQIFMINVIPEE